MRESVEALERRIGQLRTAVRAAVLSGEKARASQLRAELREAERGWEEALAEAETGAGAGGGGTAAAASAATEASEARAAVTRERREATAEGSLLPLREQVHEALSLLQVPAAPRLIATVHEAFFTSGFPTQRVTSMRRDEERSFRASPFSRPYYICAALAADRLAPSRGLLAVSTWPLEKRVIGSLSPRVDFLEAAIRVAEAIERIPAPVPAARRLLMRFAASIPGAAARADSVDPEAVKAAAEAELSVHRDADSKTRQEAARRARRLLGDAEQLFGAVLHDPAGGTPTAGTGGRGGALGCQWFTSLAIASLPRRFPALKSLARLCGTKPLKSLQAPLALEPRTLAQPLQTWTPAEAPHPIEPRTPA